MLRKLLLASLMALALSPAHAGEISDWSTTAASNNATAPDGWPEGMAPSAVNDTGREMMAAIRTWYEEAEWIDLGHTCTQVDTDTFQIASTDYTSIYQVDRRVRVEGASAGTYVYGQISASAFSTNTTVDVTLDSGSIPGTIVSCAVSIITPDNAIAPATLGSVGDVTGSISTSDFILYSGSAWVPQAINDLSEDSSPSTASDFVMTWDADASAHKKVSLTNLGSGGGSSTADRLYVLNAWELCQQNGLPDARMGAEFFRDCYSDESGIDTGTSTNETYNSSGDYYSNPGGDTNLVDFDGSSGYASFTVETTLQTGSGPFTIVAWIEADTIANNEGVVEIGGTSLQVYTNGLTLHDPGNTQIYNSSGTYLATGSIAMVAVTHASGVINDTNTKLYVGQGGSLSAIDAADTTVAGSGTPVLGSAGYIGRSSASSSYFDGEITQVGIWDEVLTSAELTAIYNSGSGLAYTSNSGNYTSSSGLIQYFGFSDGSGSTITDDAGSNDATLVGVETTNYTWTTDGTLTGYGSATDMTLVSNTVTVTSAPSDFSVYIVHQDVDASTFGTDLKIDGSRDGGSTFTECGTYTALGAYRDSHELSKATCDVSGQTSGTSVEYRVRTQNTKTQRIHGVILEGLD